MRTEVNLEKLKVFLVIFILVFSLVIVVAPSPFETEGTENPSTGTETPGNTYSKPGETSSSTGTETPTSTNPETTPRVDVSSLQRLGAAAGDLISSVANSKEFKTVTDAVDKNSQAINLALLGASALMDPIGTLAGGVGAYADSKKNPPSSTTSPTQNTNPGSQTSVKEPQELCADVDIKDVKFNISMFQENMKEEDFKKQWCSFLDSKDKGKVWGSLKPEEKKKLLDQVGKQYGTSIDIQNLKDSKWEDNDVLEIGKNKISLDFEKYYSAANKQRGFSFRGDDSYVYDRQKISEIKVGEDGGVSISFGDEATGKSSVTLNGEGVEFDPIEMKIKAGDKIYKWNGQGVVDFDSANGKMKLNFATGAGESDITNFPIMQLPGGEEVSPFQILAEGKKSIPGLTKPESGYRVSSDGKYTIDSNGVIREVKNSEISIDATGKVTEIKNAFLKKEEFKGEVFASGSYGIGKREKGSYFDLSNDVLTIVSDSKDRLYYIQGGDLKKLDAKGSGITFIRNGDYLLKIAQGKLDVKILEGPLQKENGKCKYIIDEIVNQNDPKKPFKLIKKENGEIALCDSSGKPIDLSKLQGGQIINPPTTPPTTPPGTTPPGTTPPVDVSPEALQAANTYLQSNGAGAYSLSSDGKVGPLKVTSDTLAIGGVNNLPSDLSYQDFISKVGNELEVTYTLKIESQLATPERVKDTLTKKMGMDEGLANLIYQEFEKTNTPNKLLGGGGNTGNSLSITLSNGGITSASWAGKDLTSTASPHGGAGVSFLQNVINLNPGGSSYYSGKDDPITLPTGQIFYAAYRQSHGTTN